MTASRIHLLLGLDIHDGKFPEFEAVVQKMAAVTGKEPGALRYEFFLSPDRKRCRLIETYVDIPAITAHFNGQAVQQFVPQILEVANLILLEIYGDPGPEVAAMAKALNPAVFTGWHGSIDDGFSEPSTPSRLASRFACHQGEML